MVPKIIDPCQTMVSILNPMRSSLFSEVELPLSSMEDLNVLFNDANGCGLSHKNRLPVFNGQHL